MVLLSGFMDYDVVHVCISPVLVQIVQPERSDVISNLITYMNLIVFIVN